jgi:hypothetical protein
MGADHGRQDERHQRPGAIARDPAGDRGERRQTDDENKLGDGHVREEQHVPGNGAVRI